MKTEFCVEAELCCVENESGEVWHGDLDYMKSKIEDLSHRKVACTLKSVPITEIKAWDFIRIQRKEIERLMGAMKDFASSPLPLR